MNSRRLTVLHIDDDPDTRFLARELARDPPDEPGSEVAIQWLDAPGVEDAISQYAGVSPDLILLDNRLGGDRGVDLLPRIRSYWTCPVWILTGLAEESLAEQSAEKGAMGVLSKDELFGSGSQLRSFLLRADGHPR